MVRAYHHVPASRIFALLLFFAGLLPGCGIVPRSRMDECQKLSQLLRTENARLKDQVLSLRSQNRDYADRAVDDLRRLTARDQTIERLEQSVLAYQDDRERLAAAFEQLRVSLGQRSEGDRTGAEWVPSTHGTRHGVRDTQLESENAPRKGVTQGDDEGTSG